MAAIFGLARAGAVWVPINVQLRGPGLRYVVEHCDPALVIAEADLVPTIAASEAREVAHIAKRTVISDDALSVLVPILEEIAGFGPSQIRALFEDQGLVIQEWDRVRTDWLTIRDGAGDGIIRLDAAANA